MADSAQRGGDDFLYLEDLHPGLRISSGFHTIDAQQIVEFARQYDPQAFHLDAAAAQRSLFKGLVASGWHTAAITMRLLVDSRPAIAPGSLGLGAQIAWPNATRPGDVLHVECEVQDARPSQSRPDRGVVTMRSETRNQRDEVVQVTTAKLLVLRRGAQ